MADVSKMQAQLDNLRDMRAKGALRLVTGGEEVTFRSDKEMAAAISDLERRIASAQGRAVNTVRFTSSKGL